MIGKWEDLFFPLKMTTTKRVFSLNKVTDVSGNKNFGNNSYLSPNSEQRETREESKKSSKRDNKNGA